VIPLSEKHLRTILREWVATTIREDHTPAWDQAFPIFVGDQYWRPKAQGHELPAACRIRAKDILGGLHHEYWLEEIAA